MLNGFPGIRGYELVVVERAQLQTFSEPVHFYKISLIPGRKMVAVRVYFTELKWERYPEIGMFYGYRRVGPNRWRGKYQGMLRG